MPKTQTPHLLRVGRCVSHITEIPSSVRGFEIMSRGRGMTDIDHIVKFGVNYETL